MSFAFLALYTGDYLRDTRHLTPLRHGVYLLLLMHCWDARGPVPLDEQECAGIVNCRSADEIDALRYVLDRYFTKMDDGWYNHRMQKEIERAANISNSRSEAGKIGYQAKAKQLLSKSQARASTPTPTTTSTTDSELPSRSPRKSSAVSDPMKSARGQVWLAYSEAYQERYGVRPQPSAVAHSAIKRFSVQVPTDDWVPVTRFYVGHNHQFYVAKGHHLNQLASDAPKLHMEWQRDHQITQTEAQQGDRRQGNRGVFQKLIQESKDEQSKS